MPSDPQTPIQKGYPAAPVTAVTLREGYAAAPAPTPSAVSNVPTTTAPVSAVPPPAK